MARRMYDGVASDAAAIGAQAKPGDLAAGYVDGLYKWSDADWALLKLGVIRVRIAVFAETDDGHILDVERGNATPAQSVDWALMRRAAGIEPTVYCNQFDTVTGWPAVRAAFQARGVPEPFYWVAKYDDVPVIPPGAIGKQYDDDLSLGEPWDLSVVADYWPGVDPAPVPTPAPDPAPSIRRNDMHVDLELNTPVVFTNPAAVLGDTSYLLLGSDFGDAMVRVATLSFTKGWSTTTYTLARTSGATKIQMPPDSNKLSVTLLSVTPQQGAPFPTAVGLDVLA